MAEGGEEPARGGEPDGGTLSAASIRKKAIVVGSRVDALQTGMMVPPPHHREHLVGGVVVPDTVVQRIVFRRSSNASPAIVGLHGLHF